jgi:hypothetical protein
MLTVPISTMEIGVRIPSSSIAKPHPNIQIYFIAHLAETTTNFLNENMTVRGNQPKFYLVPIQHYTDVEARSRQIKHRLERLENGTKHLKASQKWPTQKSMILDLYRRLNKIPEIIIQPPTPEQQHCRRYSTSGAARPSKAALDILLAPSSTPRAEFLFPITTGRSTPRDGVSFLDSSFLYFTFLPIELRLQIWEIELRRPKLIEAQFSSQFYSPTFIGRCTRGSALLSVCKESRELVLSLDDLYRYLTPVQRDFGKRYVFARDYSPFPFLSKKY